MGSDELHKQAAEKIGHVDDKSIFIAAQIENHAIVADKVDGRAELPFDLVRISPLLPAGDGKPYADRLLGLRVASPEFLQRPASNHLHGCEAVSCHQFGDKGTACDAKHAGPARARDR
jgi:hypothetical protein